MYGREVCPFLQMSLPTLSELGGCIPEREENPSLDGSNELPKAF